MTWKHQSEKPSPLGLYSKPLRAPKTNEHACSAPSFRRVLSDDLLRQRVHNSDRQKTTQTSLAKARPDSGLLSFLNRIFVSLRGRVTAPKQLRLLETVSLGEKRFVALVSAEGHKFLIGGGSTGVSLLTRLDETVTPDELSNESLQSKTAVITSQPEASDTIERPKSFLELAGVLE